MSSSTRQTAPAKGPYGLHPKLNKSQAYHIIKDMAYDYLISYPPIDNSAPDKSCNTTARALLRGDEVPSWQMRLLRGALTYRLELTKVATEYKNVMGIDCVDCDKFDYESWVEAVLDGEIKLKEKWNTHLEFQGIIDQAYVFDEPSAEEGWSYSKPPSYLAVAAVECGLSAEAVAEAVAKILACK